MKKLPDAEFQVMKAIWGMAPPVTSASVMEALPPEQAGWKSQTVVTLLSRLQKKGFLRSKKPGRNGILSNGHTGGIPAGGNPKPCAQIRRHLRPRLVRCLLDDQEAEPGRYQELRRLDQQDPFGNCSRLPD